MHRFLIIMAVALVAVVLVAPTASARTGNAHSYVWTRDADGDGIPNGQDDDYVRPEDGSGYQLRHGFGLALPPSFLTTTPAGNVFQYAYLYQYRFRDRKHDGEGTPAGDLLRLRLRLRDGSCE